MEDERRAILQAAVEEFAQVGLNESTMASIAGRAGLEPGVARAFFVDKQRLLRAVLNEATESMVSGIAVAVAAIDDPKEVIRTSLRLYDAWLTDHPDIVRIMVRCAIDGPEWLGELYRKSLLPSEFTEHLKQLLAEGRLRCKDPFIVHLLLDSLVLFPHMMRSSVKLMSPGRDIEQTMKKRFAVMVDLLENGLFST